jgi:hypothetical protein
MNLTMKPTAHIAHPAATELETKEPFKAFDQPQVVTRRDILKGVGSLASLAALSLPGLGQTEASYLPSPKTETAGLLLKAAHPSELRKSLLELRKDKSLRDYDLRTVKLPSGEFAIVAKKHDDLRLVGMTSSSSLPPVEVGSAADLARIELGSSSNLSEVTKKAAELRACRAAGSGAGSAIWSVDIYQRLPGVYSLTAKTTLSLGEASQWLNVFGRALPEISPPLRPTILEETWSPPLIGSKRLEQEERYRQLVREDRYLVPNLETIPGVVEAAVQRLYESDRLKESEKVGVSVTNVRTGRCVGLNLKDQFQIASIVKNFVAWGILDGVERKKIVFSPELANDLQQMLQNSKNDATNRCFDRLGGPHALQRLVMDRFKNFGFGTEIVEKIPPGGTTYKNKSTPIALSNLLTAIFHRKSLPAEVIYDLTALPGPDRFLNRTPGGLVNESHSHGKTGTTAKLSGDISILEIPIRNSVLIVPITILIQGPRGDNDRRSRCFGEISKAVVDEILRVS